MWQGLVGNLAIVALIISAWTHAQSWLEMKSSSFRRALFAIWMAAGVVSTMLMAARIEDGILFDLRVSIPAIAGLFGSPIVTVTTAAAALSYRASVGGVGMWPGLTEIALASIFGAVAHYLTSCEVPRRWVVISLALLCGAIYFVIPMFMARRLLIGSMPSPNYGLSRP